MNLPKSTFQGIELFIGIDSQSLTQLTEGYELKKLNSGQILFPQGDVVKYFGLVKTGLLKLTKEHFGRKTLMSIISQGEIVGALLMSEQPIQYPCQITAITPCELILIPKSTYLKYWFNHPIIAPRVNSMVQKRILGIQDDRSMQFFKVENRLANFIIRHLNNSQQKVENKLDFRITREELAEAVGAKTESVIRAMSKYEKLGILKTTSGIIEVLKPNELINNIH